MSETKFTLEDYEMMSSYFNRLSFKNKILYLQEHKDVLSLGADGNWWVVKVNDEYIQEELYESDKHFRIENEWGSLEMFNLIELLGLKIVDA